MLGQVSGQLEFGDEVVSLALLAGKVELFELAFLFKNPVNLDGEDLVPFLLAVEVLGTFGGIIDDFRDLGGRRKPGYQ